MHALASALLQFGPIRRKFLRASTSAIIGMTIAVIAIYLLLFAWYASTALVHTYPTDHTNLWFGFLHGYFVGPSFIVSWFAHDVTIYQSPNDGFWYNLGFLVGFGVFAK